jgi:predicted nucleic-acid-binding protein
VGFRNPYSFSAERIVDTVDAFLASDDFLVERRNLVESALAQARESRADIADCLIAVVAADLGADSTATFDKKAAKRIPGMELLK